MSRTTEITTITTKTNDAGGRNSVGVILLKFRRFTLKTFKRIIAILSLIIIFLVVSYFVYTAKRIPSENTILEVLYEVAKTT